MRIFVTGGAGYVGHVLVPRLLTAGHEVTVFDTLWYDCRLPNSANLRVIKGDIRDTEALMDALKPQHDTIIHLACISNDASFELDPALSHSINFLAFEPLVQACVASGVKRFIYASTSSVYGISNSPEVTEEHALVPLTDYNKYKGWCEPLLKKYDNDIVYTILRPATLCGYSPRMRLDLSVNALTINALANGVIKVFGGSQMRPNLHIDDMVRAYATVLYAPDHLIHGQIFNVSFENRSITDLAVTVRRIVRSETGRNIYIDQVISSDDTRSYHVNADKIHRVLGYMPLRSIDFAVGDIIRAYSNHLLPNPLSDPHYYNVHTMKLLEVK